jgi:hypothetical protein
VHPSTRTHGGSSHGCPVHRRYSKYVTVMKVTASLSALPTVRHPPCRIGRLTSGMISAGHRAQNTQITDRVIASAACSSAVVTGESTPGWAQHTAAATASRLRWVVTLRVTRGAGCVLCSQRYARGVARPGAPRQPMTAPGTSSASRCRRGLGPSDQPIPGSCERTCQGAGGPWRIQSPHFDRLVRCRQDWDMPCSLRRMRDRLGIEPR